MRLPGPAVQSEAALHADFKSILRYAQCWEDADVLLAALEVQPGDVVLSVASAGENTLSLLTRAPDRVIAMDLNPAQLAALELRVAAFRNLSHAELLELIGSRRSGRRSELYARCRPALSDNARRFWDARPRAVAKGIGGAGKFERYFAVFRRVILPLVHRRRTVLSLLEKRTLEERQRFYDTRWDTARWRAMFRVFFSERLLGWLGRDPSFFRYVNESVAESLLRRVRHALVTLDPSENPYVHWILTGDHGDALPHALRAENFDAIRNNLDRLEWHCKPIEALDEELSGRKIDAANLSDILEYLSDDNARELLRSVVRSSRSGARVAYWNMMVPRKGSEYLPDNFRALPELSRPLFERDKAFFYRDFVVEEVTC
jgi:S-adenosylmethionine-diacylglycerol 3-amino-3-carboxypropyl transferase